MVALLNILLVYANGVYPEPVSLVPLSKISQCRLGVFGYEEMLIAADFKLDLGLRVSPRVLKCIVGYICVAGNTKKCHGSGHYVSQAVAGTLGFHFCCD